MISRSSTNCLLSSVFLGHNALSIRTFLAVMGMPRLRRGAWGLNSAGLNGRVFFGSRFTLAIIASIHDVCCHSCRSLSLPKTPSAFRAKDLRLLPWGLIVRRIQLFGSATEVQGYAKARTGLFGLKGRRFLLFRRRRGQISSCRVVWLSGQCGGSCGG